MIGRTLGQYRILEELGRGGMGEVYRAEDTQLRRQVAIKVLSGRLVDDPVALARFRREARSLAALHHPKIATLFGLEETEGQPFLVMELVEGEDLTELLSRERLSDLRIREITRDIAEGLAEAHGRGIVHRDLKPGNIKISSQGRAKILDFGLALNVADTQLTQAGAALGTVAYMSPEQARGETVDSRTDLYSLGVLLHEMLVGERPLQDSNAAALMHSIASTESTPTLSGRADLAPDLAAIADRCLQARREDRFTDASQVLDQLDSETASTSASASKPSATTRPGGSARKKILVWGLAAALLALVAVVFLGSRITQPNDRDPDTELAADAAANRAVMVKSHSLAVLPFRNLAGDPELDWLEAAVPELLTASLAQGSELEVISSQRAALILEQSSKTEGELPLQAMARAGVATVISGSVLRMGENLRVQSELIDSKTARVLHSANAQAPGDDALFELIAQLDAQHRRFLEIKAISERLDEDWIQDLTTYSVDAYRAYARGRRHLQQSQYEPAVEFFLEAVTIDSTFVSAWVDLSSSYWNLDDSEHTLWAFEKAQSLRERASPRERIWLDLFGSVMGGDGAKIIQFAQELLANEPEHRFVRYLLGKGYYSSQQYEEAVEVWRPLREQKWEWIWTYLYSSTALLRLERPEEALAVLDRAEAVFPSGDPFKRSRWHRYRGRVLAGMRNWEDALAELARVLEINPDYHEAHFDLGRIHLERGEANRARAEFEFYLAHGDEPSTLERARELLVELD